jgi:hypothetical protein
MKTRILLSSVVWCLTSIPGYACYVIQTQGAGEFRTAAYWKEGREIRFTLANGIMGVAESEILNITMTSHGQQAADCHWGAKLPDLTESGSMTGESSPADTDDANAVVTARAGTPTKSEALRQFERDVEALEVRLRRIGTMSSEELLDLAMQAEALKKEMVAANEGNALNPLL